MRKLQKATAGDFRKLQSEYLNKVHFSNDIVQITRHGKTLGVVISAEEFERYMKVLENEEDFEDIQLAEEAYEEVRRKGARSWEGVKKDLGIDV